MSNLDNLTSKIIDEANNKANSIIGEAKVKAEEIMNAKKIECENIKKEILEKAKIEAQSRKQRMISSAELEVRNKKLAAKQEIIDRVFQKSEQELSLMKENEFVELLRNVLLSIDLVGNEEVIICTKFKNAITSEIIEGINKDLKNKNKKGELKLSSMEKDMNDGFILTKNGIDINYTFKALVLALRDELESEVAKILFN